MTSPLATGIVSTFPVLTGNSNVDPLLVWGYKWGSGLVGTPVTVTYSFPSVGATWIGDYWDSEPSTSFTSFNAAQKTAARQALAAWAEVANISFTEVPDTPSDVGDIRFGNSGAVTNSSSAAWAYFPYSDPNFEFPEAGDVWFDGAYAPNLQLQPGQFGYSTMLHEIGHAIGLDHPFADVPGELTLPVHLDNQRYTIMSYTPASGTLVEASTPMLFDILAIQYIYGANMTVRTGDDIYKFSGTPVLRTIWDAGGIDTFDFSNYGGNATIDLEQGHFSEFGGSEISSRSILGIAWGVTIENATGGRGNDQVAGNEVANRLIAGDGNDSISAFDGNDHLDGGLGLDYLKGGSGNDIYVIDSAGDVIDEDGSADTNDRVFATVSINLTTLGAGLVDHAALNGASAINATGNASANRLGGNAGNNVLDGAAGADILIGGMGADTYIVDNVGDQVVETIAGPAGGVDLINSIISFSLAALGNVENVTLLGAGAIDATGNALNNIITGNDGANILDGGSGNDTLIGGVGVDILVGSIGNDVLRGGDSGDESTGGAGRDTFDFDHLTEAGDTIADFALGIAGDIIDIHDLLSDISYAGSDPFADAVLSFSENGADTMVLIDADGAGAGAAVTLATLINITLTQVDTDNYIV